MKTGWLVIVFLSVAALNWAQVGVQSIHSYYKDRYFHSTSSMEGYQGDGLFPVSQAKYDIKQKVADTTKQYYWITEKLFVSPIVNFKGKNFHIKATPIFDLSVGKNVVGQDPLLYQNTRGFHFEIDLLKNVTVSTSFYENQSRHTAYEMAYFRSNGERYYHPNGYYADNAVIPGMARTKPFKETGFDYGFAFGEINYKPHQSLLFAMGNGQRFIGDGYRSILQSDNSVVAPFMQVSYAVNKRLSIHHYRSKLTNLIRRPQSATVEALYETKLSSINYITFQATKHWNIGLFEGMIYGKGDSLHIERVDAMYYNPIPVLGAMVVNPQKANSIIGLQSSYHLKNVHLYGQYAINPHSKGMGGQLGVRYYPSTGKHFLLLQLEGNLTSNLYTSQHPRLIYSQYNLPMGHIKGDDIKELVFRTSYEFKRIYAELKQLVYVYKDYSPTAHLPLFHTQNVQNGHQLHSSIELGYRFNPSINFSAFVGYGLNAVRLDNDSYTSQTFHIGIRTGLINSYRDF